MSLPLQKLPRRYAQRQHLFHGRARSPPLGLPRYKDPRGIKLPSQEKQKSSTSLHDNKSSSASDSGSNSDSNPDSGSSSGFDSGYSLKSSHNPEVEYYRQVKAGYVAAGPTLADPGDTTEKMMGREEQRWNL